MPSIKRNGFDFTDGVGLISIKLAREITKQLNIRKKIDGNNDNANDNIPSVFQIRHGDSIIQQFSSSSSIQSSSYACKGVLLADPTGEEQHILSIHSSMQKNEIKLN